MPYVQSAILIVGVALVVVGLLENGAAAVLTKAINICTECIGLG
ncbi:MAG: thioredoxin [Clostridia bacterium]|nr:thioredoxin [Clostridia bacterium]